MKIGSVGGIGVYVHWTFWLLIATYLLVATSNHGLSVGVYAVVFILGIFACVVLHEFGHAAAAKMYGIPTIDITLLPIGGVARLARMPEKPLQEFVIALAGPAVNVVIAAVLKLLLIAGVVVGGTVPGFGAGGGMIESLLLANMILVAFNLLPAFPMDGGRVLRSLLAMRTSYLRATQIAARVGRWMALGFALIGIVYGPITLLLVAAFIFIAGTAELLGVRMREVAKANQQPGGARGGAGWQARVWPMEQVANPNLHRESDHSDGDVIDAIDVREIK